MENVADALKMAAAVAVFVIALTISISSFGEVRRTSQAILDSKDRESELKYVQNANQTERIVGAETIIPSIYKAYKENYKIVFKDKNGNGISLYESKFEYNTTSGDQYNAVSYIDLSKVTLGSEEYKNYFIEIILYGTDKLKSKPEYMIPDNYPNVGPINKADWIIMQFNNAGYRLQNSGLYDKIKDKKFKESLGVYYQEEVEEQIDKEMNGDIPDDPTMGEAEKPDANRIEKRVITYQEQ